MAVTLPTASRRVERGIMPVLAGRLARDAASASSHRSLEVIVARDRNEAINSYITDMLALEDHIEKAIKGQLADLKDYPGSPRRTSREIHPRSSITFPICASLSDRRNAGGVAESVKRAGSAVAGVAAGLIDLVRTEGLPKNLRDDFTAFNLANIGYVMLQTTALALEDQEVADLAHQHLPRLCRRGDPAQQPDSGGRRALPPAAGPARLASRHRRAGQPRTSTRPGSRHRTPRPAQPVSARRL